MLTGRLSRTYFKAMATLRLELPPQKTQTAFNLRRWKELLADRELAQFEGRVETDRYGHVIMSPPPAPSHGSFQLEIGYLLRKHLTSGRVLTECPISTADGVKAADVAWASPEVMAELGNRVCFSRAPEICVEVISPGNSEAEIREKVALYFDAGAKEVWTCSASGVMSFFSTKSPKPLGASHLCPQIPKRIKLR
jgi:Uma2 family endonuclease